MKKRKGKGTRKRPKSSLWRLRQKAKELRRLRQQATERAIAAEFQRLSGGPVGFC